MEGSLMTKQDQILVIQRACPDIWEAHQTWLGDGLRWFLTKKGEGIAGDEVDPTNDLNACHEMEMTLTIHQKDRYARTLAMNRNVEDYTSHFMVAHATASQKAEAFLKVIGKWEDSA
jgi:hypothetical protein